MEVLIMKSLETTIKTYENKRVNESHKDIKITVDTYLKRNK